MRTLRQILSPEAGADARMLWAPSADLPIRALAEGSCLHGEAGALAGQSVLVRTHEQVSAAKALVEFDGLVRRLILCPPDLAEEHMPIVIRDGEVTMVVTDQTEISPALVALPHLAIGDPHPCELPPTRDPVRTEWAMFTSGTTGPPKMVVHDLAGLTGAIKPTDAANPPVWATFYDIRRYGGLQILLRGLLGGGSMVIAGADEPMIDLIRRMGRHGVTHVSGTPSHWRKVLTSGAAHLMSPAYVRLSGEIADQAILNRLKRAYPHAAVGHAYASTEAGVGFEVNDGLEGFPASLIERRGGEVEMAVVDGSLRVRSCRTATRYLGGDPPQLIDPDGFVDTGDMVELRDGRYYFAGRKSGVINVGGLKVHPEEIEQVINDHPMVQMSVAFGQRNPITGMIVVAEVVLSQNEPAGACEHDASERDEREIRRDILAFCRNRLAAFKVPAQLRIVPSLRITEGGKLLRERQS
jgi:acyl-coenzyme A synthetase/AMP-(fatty) acid ligase